MRIWTAGIISALIGLTLWQTIVWTTGVPRFILPPPALVGQTIWDSRALLAEHAVVTISEVLIGLVLGSMLGFICAISLASNANIRAIVRPMLVFSQAVPVFALAPILTLWLGYGMLSKIAMALIIIFFPVLSATLDGLLRTNKDWLALAKVMGGSPWRTMRYIKIPAAMPGFATGLRLAAVYAPIGAIIGEWVGASRGLGYLMLLANGRAKTDLMFASLFVLAAFTILLHWAVNKAATRYLDT